MGKAVGPRLAYVTYFSTRTPIRVDCFCLSGRGSQCYFRYSHIKTFEKP